MQFDLASFVANILSVSAFRSRKVVQMALESNPSQPSWSV